MFMLKSTHDRLMAATKEQISNQSFSLRDGAKKNQALTDSLAVAKTRQATLDAEIITLKAQMKDLTADRDIWKKCESDCNTQYNKLQDESAALKARIAELEKPVAIKKRRPVCKASEPTPTIVKVAMKGKVKS